MATQEDIIRLADLKYASQTTGVSTTLMNKAVLAVGIDPSDYMAVNEFLINKSYQTGTEDFYVGSLSLINI